MKSLIRYTSYFLFVLFCFVYFLPKESIYYEIEKYLKTENTIISNETIKEKALGIDISDSSLYFEEIKIADIKDINFETYLAFTEFHIKDVILDKSLERFVPLKIDEAIIKHTFLNPEIININGSGEFGVLVAEVNFIDRVVKVILNPTKKMKQKNIILSQMEKGKDEKYTYEYKF